MSAPVIPRVRKPGFRFQGLPRRWLGGRLDTHVVNAANLIFPAGEQFFCRSIRAHLDRVGPELRRRAAALIGQEARHGLEHEGFFAALEEQGLELESWLERYQALAYGRIEPAFSPEVRLATTAALEHFTACLARLVFEEGLVDDADPRARRLLYWHAAEEIEHRDVAFDLLQAVDPRYRTRLAGFGLGVLLLNGFLLSGSWHLIRQEARLIGWRRVAAEALRELADPGPRRSLPRVIPAALAFLRPGFHPEEGPGREAAARYLAGEDWRVAA
ncbi:MAG TPA: metal-dependent hydrolase [Planctomycetes bacterium]|nr:metal-dependent hydrolase [Planctomycetota bacterium]